MLKIWGRTVKSNKTYGDTVITIDDNSLSRTKQIFSALSQICLDLDLPEPIWLDSNINDFKRGGRTRFTQDSFIESVEFDYLDFYIIEET